MEYMVKTDKLDDEYHAYRPTFKDLVYTKNRCLLNIGYGIVNIGDENDT